METTYTKEELKWKECHKELLDLKHYRLADKISEVFYTYGAEEYKRGINFAKDLYTK